MQLGWKIYADDNNDAMPLTSLDGSSSRGLPGSWVLGDSWLDADPTNLQSGTLFSYMPGTGAFRCPADRTRVFNAKLIETQTPVNRSYSISASLHAKGGDLVDPLPRPFATTRKLSDILAPGPLDVWVLGTQPDRPAFHVVQSEFH